MSLLLAPNAAQAFFGGFITGPARRVVLSGLAPTANDAKASGLRPGPLCRFLFRSGKRHRVGQYVSGPPIPLNFRTFNSCTVTSTHVIIVLSPGEKRKREGVMAQGLLVFKSLADALRAGYQVYDRTSTGYLVRMAARLLRSLGHSDAEIGQLLKISQSAVYRLLRVRKDEQ